jgi:hypothetical protein
MRFATGRMRFTMQGSRSLLERPSRSRMRRVLVAALAALLGASVAAAAPMRPSERFHVSYQVPEDARYRTLHRELRASHLLEEVRGVLAPVHLPRTVTLALVECDGDANAYYDPDELSVSVCYEYVDELRRLATGPGKPAGITSRSAVHSKLLEIFLHEAGHALIDLRRIPVIGSQEEAADVFADVMLLHQRDRAVRETMLGIAWMYDQEARDSEDVHKPLADAHPLAGQRYYNTLCLAYGARPRLFAELARDDMLPAERAQGCGDEYRNAAYAVRKLMGPYLDFAQREGVHLASGAGRHAAPRKPTAAGATRSSTKSSRRAPGPM